MLSPANQPATVSSTSSRSTPTLPRCDAFIERLIRFLIPFFIDMASDLDPAASFDTAPDIQGIRAEILETLSSYGARTRSELLTAAQIIAFGFSALDLLGEASTTEMSVSMRLRTRSCANGLNRSCQQNEKTLAKRLAKDVPQPTVSPVDDTPQPQAEEILQQVQGKIDTHRSRLASARPASAPNSTTASQADRNKQIWGGAMIDALAQMGMPVQPKFP